MTGFVSEAIVQVEPPLPEVEVYVEPPLPEVEVVISDVGLVGRQGPAGGTGPQGTPGSPGTPGPAGPQGPVDSGALTALGLHEEDETPHRAYDDGIDLMILYTNAKTP